MQTVIDSNKLKLTLMFVTLAKQNSCSYDKKPWLMIHWESSVDLNLANFTMTTLCEAVPETDSDCDAGHLHRKVVIKSNLHSLVSTQMNMWIISLSYYTIKMINKPIMLKTDCDTSSITLLIMMGCY